MHEHADKANRLIFLGGIFPPSQINFIHRETRGVLQSAADGLQKSLIKGLSSHGCDMAIVNLPYIGSYPRRFTKPGFPAVADNFSGVPVYGQRFLLIPILKIFHRAAGAFWGLQKIDRRTKDDSTGKRTVVLVYAAHLPFLFAALSHRYFRQDCLVCLILPDLPEYMNEGRLISRIAKSINSRIFYRLARKIDYFVLLTSAMADRLGLTPERYIVVEGIADEIEFGSTMEPGRRAFLYTGTLAQRYGITHLVDAFRLIDAPNAELWICGDGDGAKAVEAAAKADTRIKFFGQVTRDKARELQKQATILVNPRMPVSEFTKYSFPSKTMEYMASGRPVLMYQLPGIPKEYHDHFVSPPDNSNEALVNTMIKMIGWSDSALTEFGQRARAFVLREKNPAIQAKKILSMITRD